MRRIAIINQKGGVGKTTSSVNLGAALVEQGRRVLLVDVDPQANLSLHLGTEVGPDERSVYDVLLGEVDLADAIRETQTEGLLLAPSSIDLSGAELELASVIGREMRMRDALEKWCADAPRDGERSPVDYVIFDCPPSLGLLSINALAAADEVFLAVQTQFLALMGMSKLVEVVQLIRKRLNPKLTITGIMPCLYDNRMRLHREVLGEVRKYFPGQVFKTAVRTNVKLAEAPSFGVSIFGYAPESNGAADYRNLALEVIAQEAHDPELADLAATAEDVVQEVVVEDTVEAEPSAVAEEPASEEPVAVVGEPAQEPAGCESTQSAQVVDNEPEAEDVVVATDDVLIPQAPPEERPFVCRPASPALPAPARTEQLSPSDEPVRETSQSTAAPDSVPTEADAAQEPSPEPPPSSASADPPRLQRTVAGNAVDEELRILRAKDLPALPTDAFELRD